MVILHKLLCIGFNIICKIIILRIWMWLINWSLLLASLSPRTETTRGKLCRMVSSWVSYACTVSAVTGNQIFARGICDKDTTDVRMRITHCAPQSAAWCPSAYRAELRAAKQLGNEQPYVPKGLWQVSREDCAWWRPPWVSGLQHLPNPASFDCEARGFQHIEGDAVWDSCFIPVKPAWSVF